MVNNLLLTVYHFCFKFVRSWSKAKIITDCILISFALMGVKEQW